MNSFFGGHGWCSLPASPRNLAAFGCKYVLIWRRTYFGASTGQNELVKDWQYGKAIDRLNQSISINANAIETLHLAAIIK